MTFAPPLLLAPMAGYTHSAFRELVASYGGCGLFYSEMLNARLVASQNTAKDPFLDIAANDFPRVAQVAGNDPATIARAYHNLSELGRFQAFDLNLGCPKGTAQRYGWGAALLKQPELVLRIVREARASFSNPFLVKLRDPEFEDDDLLSRWLNRMQAEGVDAFVLHPRTPRALFKRPAKWDKIAFVKTHTTIPVIGNGDVFSPQDASRMFRETGCDGVMVGRAALVRPWILRDIRSYLEAGVISEPPTPGQVLDRYYALLLPHLSEESQTRRYRLFCFWFFQNFPYGLHYLKETVRERDIHRMHTRAVELTANEVFPPYPCRPFMMP